MKAIFNKNKQIDIIIPDNPKIGLSKEKKPIKEDTGMLFEFPDKKAIITMENTKIPLDVIFILNDIVVQIYRGIPYSKIMLSAEANKVIETNIYFCEVNKITIGSEVKLFKPLNEILKIEKA